MMSRVSTMGLVEWLRPLLEGTLTEWLRCWGTPALFSGVMGASVDRSSSFAGSGQDSLVPAHHASSRWECCNRRSASTGPSLPQWHELHRLW